MVVGGSKINIRKKSVQVLCVEDEGNHIAATRLTALFISLLGHLVTALTASWEAE